MEFKIPCEEEISCGWTCNEGHLCDTCKTLEKIKELDKIFKSVPQPTALTQKWEEKIKEITKNV